MVAHPMLTVRHLVTAVLSGALLAHCGDSTMSGGADASAPRDGAVDAVGDVRDAAVVPCSPADDPDGDGIPASLEGLGDTDHDDLPDARDADSDGDGILDAFEVSRGRPRACLDAPVDSDRDGTPDFQDRDSNGDTLTDDAQTAPASAQRGAAMPARDCVTGALPGVVPGAVTAWTCHPFDTDGDGVPDYADPDADDDGVQNAQEIMPGGASAPTDTDGDGVADWRDTDSDNDTISDRDEGVSDRDRDGVGNLRDLDSDGDSPDDRLTLSDAREAGDADLGTRPVECATELDARTLDPTAPRRDGIADWLDTDSDNDGLSDGEEVTAGTRVCNPDSDGDGQGDAVETAWCRANRRTGCATDATVQVPASELWVVLPYGGAAATREVELTATVRAADVFLLMETGERGAGGLRTLQSALSGTRASLAEITRDLADDVQVGAGHFEDFAVAPFGAGADRPMWPLCNGAPGTPGCGTGWGITEVPVARGSEVVTAVQMFTPGNGGDGAGPQLAALHHTLTGAGLYDGDASRVCDPSVSRAPCWIAPRTCPDGTRGAACFRRGAMPVVVLATASDFHDGVPAAGTALPFAPYVGITPRPPGFLDVEGAFATTGARVIGLNTHPAARCEAPPSGRIVGEPCHDLLSLAAASRTLDRTGRPLVYDLSRATTAAQVSTLLTNALRVVTHDVPFDVTLGVRGESNAAMVDATRFVRARLPTCQVGSTTPVCWRAPDGLSTAEAVARTDMNGFYRVVPGTRVRFTLTLRNDAVFEGGPGLSDFVVTLQALGDGSALEARPLHVLVPAAQAAL